MNLLSSPQYGAITDLQTLGRDEQFILYRGWCRDGAEQRTSVLVKVSASDHRPSSLPARLAHEYGLAHELDDGWAVRPLELTQEHGRAVLVLADPGGVPLTGMLGAPMEVGRFLQLAIALSKALGRLHARGLIHKDVKPANVLVNAETREVWLTGLGIASHLPRERQSPEPPELVAGTLAYMAPEQTGRMNRSIDSRSDLYSLGVTFYEMLTGMLPFLASDPMEWIHCHIARQPVPPAQRVQGLPAGVSNVILKLLAKTAEDRYQTASGVGNDLLRCLAQWETQGRIDAFPLGEQDISDQLRIPEKLYGREREIETLLASFDRVVAGGAPELVLVSGYSGIGKSSVVNELHKVLVPPRGLFASGKFDQYKRDIPYATLAQAFQGLVRRLLVKGEAELEIWRNQIREALDPNASVMFDLVPELKLIIGPQPPVPDLPPQDAKNRFQLVLRRFIGVFARPEHPLAVFLDDLQWLDAATLDLLEDLLSRPDMRHLLLIGAYRDNEVDERHPLMRKLQAIRDAGASVHDILLAPLSLGDLQQLIADALHCERDRALPLTQLVHEKTAGNPFFAIQFVFALAEERLLTFDAGAGAWSWDVERVRLKGYTDNVVDLLIGKLSRFPVDTQNALKQLACMGNSAEIGLLAQVFHDPDQMHRALWEAVRAGLVVRSEVAYSFLHDRVQEAAYSLIPQEARALVHLEIGRLLASRTRPDELEDRVFEIVNQFNRASHLVTAADERTRIAELNLIAGKRAKVSTAHASALAYLAMGRAMVGDAAWDERYDLVFALELHTAECEVLTADLTGAEQRLAMLASRARTLQHDAAVTSLRLTLYTTLDRSDRAVEVCLEFLRRGGTDWPPHPSKEEARKEYERMWSQLGNRPVEDLVDLPLMVDPEALATIDVLTEVVTPALFSDENLVALVICRMVSLSIEHGNADGSCFAYVWFGIIAGPHFGNYAAGFKFGQLGYDLVEKRGLHRFQARTYMCFGNLVMPWTKHIRAGRDLVRRAFDAANKVGDLTFAAYSCNNLNTNLLATGEPLEEVEREIGNGLAFASKARFGMIVDIITAQRGLVRTLRGLTRAFGSFDDDGFDETRFEDHLTRQPRLVECWYWIRKLQARYCAGDYQAAIQASLNAQRLIWTSPSLLEVAEHVFYSALSWAASCDSAKPDQMRGHREALSAHHRQLEVWAENCPQNFETRAALVGAEIARIENRELEAMHLYEQAIRSARNNGFIHNEALANELMGLFCLRRGLETSAFGHLRNARACYARWGAHGKVAQLEQRYPRLDEHADLLPIGPEDSALRQMDVMTVVNASQAVSGEIILPRLIETLMKIAIENAGADRGVLILRQADAYWIEAEARTRGDRVDVVLHRASMSADMCPEALLRYVIRTQESVILEDARKSSLFPDDAYLKSGEVRSVLALPLLLHGKLGGLLYLENRLTTHAFNPKRVSVLKILASQAAISLENTRLYGDLQDREARVRRLVDSNIIGVIIWDAGGRILDANEAFLAMLQYTRDELVSARLRWTEMTPPEWRAQDEQALAQLMSVGAARPFEKEYVRKDGRRLPVLVGGALFEGRSDEGVAFVLDLSSLKRAEQELREREERFREELGHLSRVAAMGELAASIAHELNQPLSAVVSNASAGQRFIDGGNADLGELRDLLGDVMADARRAGDVIDGIRGLVRKTVTARQPVNLNELVVEVARMTHPSALLQSIQVETLLEPDLPAIEADPIQIQQVLLNLVINAFDAMREVPVSRRKVVIATALNGGGAIQASVRDYGIGIPEEARERVFDRFFTTKPKGVGMGLAIARSIVESHRGTITADNAEGGGALFHFTLPFSGTTTPA